MHVLVNILLVINVFVCIALVAVVLLQRSEGGALGMGGGGGPSGFMSARGAGDLLTRITWILAGAFFILSISMTVLTGRLHGAASIVDHINANSLDLATPQGNNAGTPPPATSSAPPAVQAPTPQAQIPTAPAPADPLAILAAPTVQSQVAPAQPQPAAPPKN